jgi:hypothetical protein
MPEFSIFFSYFRNFLQISIFQTKTNIFNAFFIFRKTKKHIEKYGLFSDALYDAKNVELEMKSI